MFLSGKIKIGKEDQKSKNIVKGEKKGKANTKRN